jgi:hypothetical protein
LTEAGVWGITRKMDLVHLFRGKRTVCQGAHHERGWLFMARPNWQESKGRKPCPECIKQKKERIRYIGQDYPTCYDCLPDEEKDRIEKLKDDLVVLIRKYRDKTNARRREVYRERKAARV